MKKTSFALVTCLLLFVLMSTPSGSYSQRKDEAATLVFARSNRIPIEVKFTRNELERIALDYDYLLTKLNAAGVKCCEERQRISDCIWRCCDRSKVSTCDTALVKALEELWGG